MIRILLADDHQILREGIRRSFETAGETIVAEAADGEAAVTLSSEYRPDVVVMDLSMPVLDGVAATKRIRELLPETKVVVLTMHDDVDSTRRAIEAGAVAYLSKGCAFTDVLATVRSVAAGETGLTPDLASSMLATANGRMGDDEEPLLSARQVEILQAIANGATTKQVARELGITQKTVHNHLNAVYRRLDTQSLTHAVLSAVRLGIIQLN
ncbi:MAG: response regulator transcription factor [Acidimicrobiales bacterium]|nr:response regulator transcription factor [Acidimicrobiales bacterium]